MITLPRGSIPVTLAVVPEVWQNDSSNTLLDSSYLLKIFLLIVRTIHLTIILAESLALNDCWSFPCPGGFRQNFIFPFLAESVCITCNIWSFDCYYEIYDRYTNNSVIGVDYLLEFFFLNILLFIYSTSLIYSKISQNTNILKLNWILINSSFICKIPLGFPAVNKMVCLFQTNNRHRVFRGCISVVS